MRRESGFFRLSGALLALAAGLWSAPAGADDTDPPGRAARLSDAEGSVALEPAGLADWTPATLNRPLTTGDRLWSDAGSRAEVDAGDLVARLGAVTGFAWLNLSDSIAQMQLSSGTLIVRVRDIQANQIYEIDTPNLAVSLQQPGSYRIEVAPSGESTVVKVDDGAAVAAGGGQTLSIAAQQQVTFNGANAQSYDVASLAAPDALDGWSAARDQQAEDSASSEYVASDTPGSQDLDNSGTWQQTPEYGYVWVPSVVLAGWAPYRFGQWVWVSPWGWTWVDNASWGYAPFHYGRWAQCANGSWCWIPGPRGMRATYAPALVAWVGSPAGAAGPFNGNVGWFPLAPREIYVPAYRASTAYVRRVNVSNTIIINQSAIANLYASSIPQGHYANNRATAVTAVPQSVFGSGQRLAAASLVQVTTPVLAGAVVTAAAPAITPSVQGLLAADGRRLARPPPALAHRTVVAHAPPPPAPVPFATLSAAVAANGGHLPDGAELARLRGTTPSSQVRLLAIAGPLVAAGAPAHHAANAHPGSSVAASATEVPLSFAERERILEHPTNLPPPVHAAETARANAFVPPQFPPESAPQPVYAPPARSRTDGYETPSTGAAAGSSAPPAPLPVYHPPNHADPAAPTATRPAAPLAHAPPAAPAAHPSPPPAAPKSARDSAAHADRDSRERLVR
jgi:hypothetical protein